MFLYSLAIASKARVDIEDGTPGWKLEWLYITQFDDRAKRVSEFRVTAVVEVATVFEEIPFIPIHPHSSMVTFLAICFIHQVWPFRTIRA